MIDQKGAPMRSFAKSEAYLERALRTIPLGSQTFSKSRTQYPHGVSPYFLTRGKGGHVWDVDGNEYIDFVSSLASITLGYSDPDVDAAVREQLDSGVILSLPHPIEAEVAELICDMVPCAEMVRFGKNGSDATAGAIRIARAFTGRDHVAVCGYHGWQDWYIGTTPRNRGVPQATRDLSHPFQFNDIASLEAIFADHPGAIAVVILEPMSVEWPADDFLQKVKDMTARHGAVLVFDETITGFRYANGGAQEYFGVTPDLASFGKGLANGYPVSAIAGRRDIMMLMEEVFFSFTFGGEMLSLAAAKATLQKLQREPVVKRICEMGDTIRAGLDSLITKYQLGDLFGVKGHPSWSFLTLADARGVTAFEVKTLLMQEMHQHGLLSVGTHNVNYAHSDADIETLLSAYGDILPMIGEAATRGDLLERLRCEPLVPLFKVR
jgi:glutamate-1-semialdehyde 2,1-aminomutase